MRLGLLPHAAGVVCAAAFLSQASPIASVVSSIIARVVLPAGSLGFVGEVQSSPEGFGVTLLLVAFMVEALRRGQTKVQAGVGWPPLLVFPASVVPLATPILVSGGGLRVAVVTGVTLALVLTGATASYWYAAVGVALAEGRRRTSR